MGDGVQGLDDSEKEGPHSSWRRIILLVGLQLASHLKFELPHAVVTGVLGPHRCEDLANQVEVLLDRSLLDRLPLRGHKARMDTLGENMEERNGILNVFVVVGNLQPAAEVPPLAPGGGVFLEDYFGETLGD